MVTDIFRSYVKSYKDLPLNLYQIQWKFRDEVRPRFGVMRSREFLMKDAYSFDMDYEGAKAAYNRMFVSYLRTFERVGMKAIPMRADTGPIGGDLSHEFIILADTGESQVFCHKDYLSLKVPGADVNFRDDAAIAQIVKDWTTPYAATDEMHDEKAWAQSLPTIKSPPVESKSAIFSTSAPNIPNPWRKSARSGWQGTSRFHGLLRYRPVARRAAIIEASHDDAGIIWPEPVAPFDAGIINMKPGDAACDAAAGRVYDAMINAGKEPLLDDTPASAATSLPLPTSSACHGRSLPVRAVSPMVSSR